MEKSKDEGEETTYYNRKRESRRRKIIALILAVIILSSAYMIFVYSPVNVRWNPAAPINIQYARDFNMANGVVGGSGTVTDPYLIQGWHITASQYGFGIYVGGAAGASYFVIRSCEVRGDSSNYDLQPTAGIKAMGCCVGVENCTIINAQRGIEVQNGVGVIIANNTCSFDEIGIYLGGNGSNNTLTDNRCHNNTLGIYIDNFLKDNLVAGNNCSFNGVGIKVASSYSSSRNTIANNLCSYNLLCGIYLVYVYGNKLVGNTLLKNGVGINSSASGQNEIHDNFISENTGFGILLFSGSWSDRIWNNTFDHNNGADDAYSSSHAQAREDISLEIIPSPGALWNSSLGYGNFWSDWKSPDSLAPFGIVDSPYSLSGSAGAKDFFPLTTPRT